MEIDGRQMSRTEQYRELTRQLRKLRRRLENSVAHNPNPRAGDLERRARIKADIARFERLVEAWEAGADVPPSPRTGEKTRLLPDEIGQPERGAS